jgi:tetratricopeptide (TPR) repeat protein
MVGLADLEIIGASKRHPGLKRGMLVDENREVLVKLFPDAETLPDSSRYRFRSEAERFTRVEHRNLVRFLAVDVDDDQGLYVILERPPGRSLGKRLREGNPIVPDEAVAVMTKVALALHYLHAHGLVHRNVSPRSIWVENGEPTLADPALLRDLEPESVRVGSGRYAGRPEIWAPEQVGDQEELTPATDVYGLGATLYALLVGKPPFVDLDEAQRLEAITKEKPPAPSTLRPGISPDLDAICLRCLQKDPAKRYGSAGAVADDLARLQRREPVSAAAELDRASPYHPFTELLVALLAVASMVAVGLAWDARARLSDQAFALRQAKSVAHQRGGRITALEQALEESRAELERARARSQAPPRDLVSPTDRRRAEALFNEGFAATVRGAYDEAIERFGEALKLDPHYARALVNRGYARSKLERHSEAISDFDRALALDADFAEAWSNRGNSRQALGHYEQAVGDYSRALSIDPEYRRAYANRATALFKLERYQEAIADCDQALALDPEHAQALACRGLSQARLGETQAAQADLTRSLELAPNHPRAGTLREELAKLSPGDD